MPDVLKIAIDRREALVKEITALEKFIGMANELLSQAAAKNSSETAKPKTTLKPAPPSVRVTSTPRNPSESVETASASQTEAFLKARLNEPSTTPAKTG